LRAPQVELREAFGQLEQRNLARAVLEPADKLTE